MECQRCHSHAVGRKETMLCPSCLHHECILVLPFKVLGLRFTALFVSDKLIQYFKEGMGQLGRGFGCFNPLPPQDVSWYLNAHLGTSLSDHCHFRCWFDGTYYAFFTCVCQDLKIKQTEHISCSGACHLYRYRRLQLYTIETTEVTYNGKIRDFVLLNIMKDNTFDGVLTCFNHNLLRRDASFGVSFLS